MISCLKSFFGFLVAMGSFGIAIADESKQESKEARRERLQIAVQAICPISGDPLTGHAKPIKMTDPNQKKFSMFAARTVSSPNRIRNT